MLVSQAEAFCIKALPSLSYKQTQGQGGWQTGCRFFPPQDHDFKLSKGRSKAEEQKYHDAEGDHLANTTIGHVIILPV